MKNFWTVKGFTLFEMLVTMALSTIVISIAYKGVLNVQNFLYTISNEAQFVDDFTTFKKRMILIINDKNALREKSEGVFYSYNNNDTIFVNLTGSNLIITSKHRCDTFMQSPTSFKIEYAEVLHTNDRIVREAVLHFNYKKHIFGVSFKRRSPATPSPAIY